MRVPDSSVQRGHLRALETVRARLLHERSVWQARVPSRPNSKRVLKGLNAELELNARLIDRARQRLQWALDHTGG